METLLFHPKNEKELLALKNFAKKMKISFETKKEEEPPYNPEFVAKILQADEDSKNGKGRRVTMDELDALWK